MIKIRELEEQLRPISFFEKPNLLLEQYSTSIHIASRMLYVAQTQFGDIENCIVADLGVGCGILSIGAVLLGASQVIGFDIDLSALKILDKNCQTIGTDVEVICCNVNYYLPGMCIKKFNKFCTLLALYILIMNLK
jgi:predicted RNA methylase